MCRAGPRSTSAVVPIITCCLDNAEDRPPRWEIQAAHPQPQTLLTGPAPPQP